MSRDFTSIDFETANHFRHSVCGVGLTRVRDGQIVNRFQALVCPPEGPDSFKPMNIRIHGITPESVRSEPGWEELLPKVMSFIGNDHVVAHNAAFDSSVLRRSSEYVGVTVNELPFICTYRASKALLTLGSYSLPFVARELGLPDFQHHDAMADADAAAMVALALVDRSGLEAVARLPELSQTGSARGIGARSAPAGSGVSPDDWLNVAGAGSLEGEVVCFTGGLSSMSRAVAQGLVQRLGGQAVSGVSKRVTVVVAGDFDPRRFRSGAKLSRKLEQAFTYSALGERIVVMSEAEFLEHVEITEQDVASVKLKVADRTDEG